MFVTLLDRLLGSQDVSVDRRGVEPREPLAMPVDAEYGGQRRKLEIGNISSGGFMARGAEAPAIGTPIVLHLDGRRFTGQVRWSGDGRFGVRFDDPLQIDAALVERYRPASIEASKVMSRWMV